MLPTSAHASCAKKSLPSLLGFSKASSLFLIFAIMNDQTITDFYTAFQEQDAEKMAGFYHPDVVFNDPVFLNLNQKEVQNMWKMLIERSKGNLKIEFHSVQGNENTASCIWEAKYPFSQSGRQVHNIIHSSMEFKDGLIIKHNDNFNFWRWSRMALGTSGVLLGWTPLVRKKVQTTARESLNDYMSK